MKLVELATPVLLDSPALRVRLVLPDLRESKESKVSKEFRDQLGLPAQSV